MQGLDYLGFGGAWVGFDPAGNVFAFWASFEAGSYVLKAYYGSDSGPWNDIVTVGPWINARDDLATGALEVSGIALATFTWSTVDDEQGAAQYSPETGFEFVSSPLDN